MCTIWFHAYENSFDETVDAVIDDLCGNFCYSDYLFIHSHFIAVSGQSVWDGITVDVPDTLFWILPKKGDEDNMH